MAYDLALTDRIRFELVGLSGITEKKMFGGVGFMLNGNMACGVNGDELIVRVGPQRHEEALTHPGVRTFDMTGKPMAGWVFVSHTAVEDAQVFREWLRWGVEFAASLPPKS